MTGDALDAVAVERLRRIGGERLVRQMIDLYLHSGQERIATLEEGLRSGDAHRLQHAAQALETMSSTGQVDAELVARVRREYDASERALRALLEAAPGTAGAGDGGA